MGIPSRGSGERDRGVILQSRESLRRAIRRIENELCIVQTGSNIAGKFEESAAQGRVRVLEDGRVVLVWKPSRRRMKS